ncbi:MAG: hypothetical protein A4E48_02286 [Methanosaeta sp. PtaU1.Bin060]|jgi:hypothetical protein|nr:MAG: hypothetical protein A4E48_02286 [Methanosaeta sp. PtaU1.Bin060]
MGQLSAILLALLAFSAGILVVATDAAAVDTLAQNMTEHSWIFINGYMDESRIYQTQEGFHGSKMVLATRGSGIGTRTIDSFVYKDSNEDDMYLKVDSNYDYHPYTPPAVFSQSDLRNALCAKNYEVGSVFSETYEIGKDLIKDTHIYQDDNISIYNINSEIQGTARIGSRVQKNSKTVPSFIMSGTYVGYAKIIEEIQAGNSSVLNLPCP